MALVVGVCWSFRGKDAGSVRTESSTDATEDAGSGRASAAGGSAAFPSSSPPHLAQVLLFHHAQGLTSGVLAFADDLRARGHVVNTPDLYDGKTFADLNEGVAHAGQVGFGTIVERGRLAAESLPQELVYAGFSLGGLPAQMLAQTRPGARGALLFHTCVPPSEFGGDWPPGVPLQIHMAEGDEWLLPPNEDLEAARRLVETADEAELFLYPGERHLFADASLPEYDESAAALLEERVLAFLAAR
jgi:dienelactone hydrolase